MKKKAKKAKPILPPLKKWTKTNLSRADWDLESLCDKLKQAFEARREADGGTLVYRAITWEMERELGSEKPPFDLAAELRREPRPCAEFRACEIVRQHDRADTTSVAIDPPLWLFKPRSRNQPLNEWHLGNLSQYITKDTYEADRGAFTICALEIPCTDDEGDVVEAFRRWLRKFRGGSGDHRKPERRYAWRTEFRELAVHRLSSAGYTRLEGLQMLQFKNKEPLSDANWLHAIDKAQGRMGRRYAEILTKARRLGRNWKDCFIRR